MIKRCLSAIVLLLILIPVLIAGGKVFCLAVGIISILAFKEILDLQKSHSKIPSGISLIAMLALLVLVFYENNASFALYTHPWLGVGGGFNRGINAGMFAFDFEFGRLTDYDTFRIILTPTGGTS